MFHIKNVNHEKLPLVLPLEQGGTGKTAVAQAVSDLGLVTTAMVDQPLGVAVSDQTGKVSKLKLPPTLKEVIIESVDGRRNTYYPNSTYQIQITNFDAFNTYSVSVTAGTVSRVGDMISLTTPNTTGPMQLTVNNRTITLNVVSQSSFPYPTITSPSNNATGQSLSLVATCSSHAVSGLLDRWTATEWQLSDSVNFTNILQTSNSAVTKTQCPFTNLAVNTVYYMRCRYVYPGLSPSPWSGVVAFTTRTTKFAVTASVFHSNRFANEFLGKWSKGIRFSADNKRMFVSSPNLRSVLVNGTSTGGVVVFRNDNGTWVDEGHLTADMNITGSNSSFFSENFDINAAGDVLFISCSGRDKATGGYNTLGIVYFYIRQDTRWFYKGFLNTDELLTGATFGKDIEIADDVSRIFVSQMANGAGVSATNTGYVHVFRREIQANGEWKFVKEANLLPAAGSAGEKFGTFLSCSADGSRVVAVTNGGTNKATVFSRSGTTWTREATLTPTVTNGTVGTLTVVAMDSTGQRLFLCSPGAANSTPTDINGKVFVFKRTDTTWNQEAVLVHQTALDNQVSGSGFGSSVACSADGLKIYTTGLGIQYCAVPQRSHVFSYNGSAWVAEQQIRSEANVYSGEYHGSTCGISPDGTLLGVATYGSAASGTAGAGMVQVYA